ncbi:hypothetical protein CANARDRAFT_176967 [[Candida] arabinofermentans NRRL YB-2248]|uniref:Uncharacterized protein n=1 Tax=[Candida] arabinofermentans NRRL YB-2248 TaxID=983967 RepID=A0A1E4SY31_9ASCO|nr:hypothetical protein CANARDRAFT_176967 [[Candida] arabinofermentans NRRL YB-2248]
MSSKGFELEDDIEFCPDIPQHAHANANANAHAQAQQHSNHRFNPYTASFFSPCNSPSSSTNLTTASPLSPPSTTSNYTNKLSPITPASSQRPSSPNLMNSPRSNTPRVKKILEIVNPHTGLKIENSVN